jgi:hypothetical protein
MLWKKMLIGTGLAAAVSLAAGCQSSSSSTTKPVTASAHGESAVCDAPDTALVEPLDKKAAAAEPAAAAATPAPAEAEKPKVFATFGAEQKLTDADAVPASKVIANPAEYADKYVRVTGKVTQVCEKKGCWVRVAPAEAGAAPAEGTGDIFIKFRDPPAGRLVPMEALGKDVVVEGTLKAGQMSERAARHFKEDAGAPEEEINKIVGPQKQMFITGAALKIEGVEKPS